MGTLSDSSIHSIQHRYYSYIRLVMWGDREGGGGNGVAHMLTMYG